MNHDGESIEAYYARRAAEYERIYDKPERQADLARLRNLVPELLTGRDVLEIACGTGYWTPLIAAVADSVLALDVNAETLAIARTKPYPRGNVSFDTADAYRLPAHAGGRNACFAGFWWSHVPLERLDGFLDALHARLMPGARLVFLDNRYVEGSSTPLARTDANGNTYQQRRLTDGSVHEVLKNFPSREDALGRVGSRGHALRWIELEYYWLVSYELA